MLVLVILALIIAAVAVIFALQNITPVTVTFFLWSYHGSLALVLLAALAVGVLICLLAAAPGLVRHRWTAGSQRKKLNNLETQRDDLRRRAEDAEKEVKELEEQVANLSAELERVHSSAPGGPPPAA